MEEKTVLTLKTHKNDGLCLKDCYAQQTLENHKHYAMFKFCCEKIYQENYTHCFNLFFSSIKCDYEKQSARPKRAPFWILYERNNLSALVGSIANVTDLNQVCT